MGAEGLYRPALRPAPLPPPVAGGGGMRRRVLVRGRKACGGGGGVARHGRGRGAPPPPCPPRGPLFVGCDLQRPVWLRSRMSWAYASRWDTAVSLGSWVTWLIENLLRSRVAIPSRPWRSWLSWPWRRCWVRVFPTSGDGPFSGVQGSLGCVGFAWGGGRERGGFGAVYVPRRPQQLLFKRDICRSSIIIFQT